MISGVIIIGQYAPMSGISFTFRTSIIITLVGEGTSIFSGFVVFTVLGFMANELGVPVEEVVKSGTYG